MRKEQNPELAFIGYTAIDVNITPTGRTTLFGGAAYFGAIAASRLIDQVGLVTRVGNDYKISNLMDRVSKKGIMVVSDSETAKSTQIYFSDSDHTDRQILLERGAATSLKGNDIPEEWKSSLKRIHVATMIPNQQSAILKYIKENIPQVKISIDTDLEFLSDPDNLKIIKHNFEQSDLGFVNRKEYAILRETINAMPEAVVKLDKDGSFYMQEGSVKTKTSTKRVNVVDVTGAGDIFAGTFLACLSLNHSNDDALHEATETATKSVTQEGISHLFK